MRHIVFIAMLTILSLDPGLFTLYAQTLPTKKEAEDLLQKAADAVDLWTSDTPPFHLLASVHYELAGQASDGTYDLVWASPDRYREHFAMGSVTEMQVALDSKLYILRNTSAPTLPLWATRTTLRSVKSYFLGRRVKSIHAVLVGGLQRTCFDSEDEHAKRQDCFDPLTNHPVSVTFAISAPQGPLSITTEELKHLHEAQLGNFSSLGKKYYPMSVIDKTNDLKLEVRITTLDETKTAPVDELAPPAGAQVLDWCPLPATKGTLQFPSGILGELDPPGGAFPYYVLVGQDGRAEKTAPMRSAGSRIDGQMATRLRMSKFPIKSCGGNPIEYETVMFAPIVMRLPHY